MFATPAVAQTTQPASGGGGLEGLLAGPLPMMLALLVLFYFLILRPQQKRMKDHQQMVSGLKRGDTVVLASGVIGKVTKVEDKEVAIEIAPTVNVKVVRSMISEVRARGEPAPANDAKS
jgi:preprotein translocase subunit YajC